MLSPTTRDKLHKIETEIDAIVGEVGAEEARDFLGELIDIASAHLDALEEEEEELIDEEEDLDVEESDEN